MFLWHLEQSIKDTFKTIESWSYPSFLSGNAQQNDRRTRKPCECHFMIFLMKTLMKIERQAKQTAERDLQNTDLKLIRAKKHQLHIAWVLSLPVSDHLWPEEPWHYWPYCSSPTHRSHKSNHHHHHHILSWRKSVSQWSNVSLNHELRHLRFAQNLGAKCQRSYTHCWEFMTVVTWRCLKANDTSTVQCEKPMGPKYRLAFLLRNILALRDR